MSTGLTGKASIDRPWLNYYPEPFKNVEVPKMTIEAFLRMKNRIRTDMYLNIMVINSIMNGCGSRWTQPQGH